MGDAPLRPADGARHVERDGGLKPTLRAHKREAGLWRRRPWERHLRSGAAVAAAVRYCWINPVRHGLVQ